MTQFLEKRDILVVLIGGRVAEWLSGQIEICYASMQAGAGWLMNTLSGLSMTPQENCQCLPEKSCEGAAQQVSEYKHWHA